MDHGLVKDDIILVHSTFIAKNLLLSSEISSFSVAIEN